MPEGNGDVAEIVRLEGQAAQTEKASSADRWHAAYLIALQLEKKTYRQLSADIKAAGGKGSIGHLERMKKCWDLVGAMQWEAIKDDFAAYPNFTNIYQSDEVRGEGDQDKGGDRRQSEKETAADLVGSIAKAVQALRTDRDLRASLTAGDLESLQDSADKIEALIHRVRR